MSLCPTPPTQSLLPSFAQKPSFPLIALLRRLCHVAHDCLPKGDPVTSQAVEKWPLASGKKRAKCATIFSAVLSFPNLRCRNGLTQINRKIACPVYFISPLVLMVEGAAASIIRQTVSSEGSFFRDERLESSFFPGSMTRRKDSA